MNRNLCNIFHIVDIIFIIFRCKEVISEHCDGSVVPIGSTVILKKREAEADPQFYHAGFPGYAHQVFTKTIKTPCAEVKTEHCIDVPVVVEKTTPVETCHVVTKVDCTPAVHSIPKTVCEPGNVETIQTLPAAVVNPVAYHHGK